MGEIGASYATNLIAMSEYMFLPTLTEILLEYFETVYVDQY